MRLLRLPISCVKFNLLEVIPVCYAKCASLESSAAHMQPAVHIKTRGASFDASLMSSIDQVVLSAIVCSSFRTISSLSASRVVFLENLSLGNVIYFLTSSCDLVFFSDLLEHAKALDLT